MTTEEAVQKLDRLQSTLSAYQHALGLLFYDGATAAPRGTAANRARTAGVLGEALYRLQTGPETAELLAFLAENSGSLGPRERRMAELLQKEIGQTKRIPPEEYAAYRQLGAEANAVWRTAKERSDFALFEPCLRRRFDISRRIAGYCAPDRDPYDYWLDRNEEGLDRAACDTFFRAVRRRIVPLLQAVQDKPRPDNAVVKGRFPAERQAVLARRVMELLRLDPLHVGLGTTEHPFTTTLGSHLDGRITTHYYEEDLSYSLFSVIHEGGHALYNGGVDDSLVRTVLDGGASAGLHESQSRFYENYLGRSRAFCHALFPILREIFPEHLRSYTAEDFWRAVNRVEPSLIRTQADELTYCLHVMVRYQLEKAVMDGALDVRDLPGEWNRLYREYLGVEVPDDRRGVLQDCHWADGYLGYFPSYALGNAYGAQFLKKMRETVDVDGCLLRGDLGPINDWNRQHIWRHGRLYRPGELFEAAAGAPFDPSVYTDYLEEKYAGLYRL
jgi:carboxypeptidase Taq